MKHLQHEARILQGVWLLVKLQVQSKFFRESFYSPWKARRHVTNRVHVLTITGDFVLDTMLGFSICYEFGSRRSLDQKSFNEKCQGLWVQCMQGLKYNFQGEELFRSPGPQFVPGLYFNSGLSNY